MKIVVAAMATDQYLEELRSSFPEVEFVPAESEEAQRREIVDADVFFGRPSRGVFLAAERLRWLQWVGTGIDEIGAVPELADSDVIYSDPAHPYTQALLSAVPVPDPVVEATRQPIILPGETPSPLNPPSGCVFHPRCPMAEERCSRETPEFREVRPNHWAACLLTPGYDEAPAVKQ